MGSADVSPRLAYLGLGNMGRVKLTLVSIQRRTELIDEQAMCGNLVKKGNLGSPLILYNRTASRAEQLAQELGNCSVANSAPEAVASADIIFTCLTDDDAVLKLFRQILDSDVTGKLFVNCSTTQPGTSDDLAAMVEKKGAGVVTMPVFGEPSMAEKGLLICVPAGKADLVDRVRPYCTGVIGRGVIDFSNETHGKASLLKVIGNVFIVNMIETVAEGLVLAEQSKLGMDNLHKFIQAIFPGPFALYSQRMISGDYYKREEPVVSIDMARHLAGEVLALAAASGTKLKAYEAGYKHMEMVQSHAGEKGDISGIYGAVRQESGLAYENSEGGK
ncbi:MAG: hypothetical protein LQ345_005782 [Seirophora villosa]|nr:MAG: hypothetical protein LQ345_005782 [Seirophora villosa]